VFDIAWMTAELPLIWIVVGELFSATDTIDCMRITALNLFKVRIPPCYTAFISTEIRRLTFSFWVSCLPQHLQKDGNTGGLRGLLLNASLQFPASPLL